MEEKLTMDDFKEELEASYKAAEKSGAQDSEELDPVWATLQQYMDDKEVLNVKIGGVVNAGVIAYVDGVRVITVDPEKKRLVLSAREILRDEARAEAKQKEKEAFDQIKVGDVLDGKVENLKDYGAFIRLANGLSGLVHVSQISDKRVTSPEKVLKVGQDVQVKVIAIKDGKLSLSMKALLVKEDEPAEDEHYTMPKSENISTNLGSLLAPLIVKDTFVHCFPSSPVLVPR